MNTAQQLLCPAAELRRDASIIGIIPPDGKVSFFGKPVPAVGEFRQEAVRRGHAERNFRFAAPCLGAQCSKWKQGRCSLVGALVHASASNHEILAQGEPHCGMRERCYWQNTGGAKACQACRYVSSDARLPKTVRFSAPPSRREQAA